jgi:HK97 family phage major capsid protein
MEAFRHYLKTGEVIKAVINEGTTNEGGVAVPKELIPTIIGRRDEMSLLGQFNFRRFTTSVRQVDIPVQDAKADFAVVAESGAANQDEPDFANSRTINIYRYNMLMKVTNEFLADQQANFDQFITEEIARAYARLVNQYIITIHFKDIWFNTTNNFVLFFANKKLNLNHRCLLVNRVE